MEEKSENIFQIENSLALKSVDKSNDNNNNNKNIVLNRNISETDSEDLSDGSVEEISKFDKYTYTFLLCYAQLTYGIALTCMSPALLNFTCVLDQKPSIVSHFFTLFGMGTIIGSCFGFIFKYVNRQLVLVIFLVFYSMSTALVPLSPEFIIFYLFGFISGLGAGVLDVVQTVWLFEMWSVASGSILQLSEFSFGLGITIGPLIVRPYVFDDEYCTNGTYLNITGYSKSYYSKELLTPFMISGSLQFLGAVLLVVMYFYSKYVPIAREEEKEVIEKEIEEVLKPIEKLYQRRYTVQILENKIPGMSSSIKRNQMAPRYSIQISGSKRIVGSGTKFGGSLRHFPLRSHTFPVKRRFSSFQVLDTQIYKPPDKLPKKIIIGLGAVCFATALVSEAAFVDFSPTFFRYYANFHTSTTAVLLSVMTASYTLTRALGIFVAMRVRPQHILFVTYCIVFSGIIMLFFADEHESLAWMGNIIFGIGIASFWSATFSHIETYFEITDRIGTIYVLLLGALEIPTQFIEGPLLEEEPEVLIFYCFSCLFVSFVCFVTIRVIIFRFDRSTHKEDKDEDNDHVNHHGNNKINTDLYNELPVTRV